MPVSHRIDVVITQLSVRSAASDHAVMNGKSSGLAVGSESVVTETELAASYSWSNYGFGDHSNWVSGDLDVSHLRRQWG